MNVTDTSFILSVIILCASLSPAVGYAFHSFSDQVFCGCYDCQRKDAHPICGMAGFVGFWIGFGTFLVTGAVTGFIV